MIEAWVEIAVDDRRALIYGPRIGRLYLLPADDLMDARFQRVIGLTGIPRADGLPDPVDRIVHDLTNVKGDAADRPPLGLSSAYLLMLASRHILPLRVAARIVRKAAALLRRRSAFVESSSNIGRLVHTIERRVGIGDCYPRALMTAFLCLSARRSCTLAVGVLAPTRKMHAWCGVDGELPYEPLPEHYLYQPVWTLTLSP